MARRIVQASTPESAEQFFREMLTFDETSDFQLEIIELGDWVTRTAYLHDGHSSINPPFMEAYLDLQEQIYHIASIAKTGGLATGKLNKAEKLALQIEVVVVGGSSNTSVNLQKIFTELGKNMIDKIPSRQLVILVLGSALIFCSYSSFSAYLQHKKEVISLELASKEKAETLNALKFANHEQVEFLKQIIEALKGQGYLGKQIAEAAVNSNEAFLKAASRVERSRINGQELSGKDATLLRSSNRLKIRSKTIKQEVIVYDINTEKPDQMSIGLSTLDGRLKIRISFKDELFNKEDKSSLIKSLDDRVSIWVELLIKETKDEIKSVELIQVIEPPAETLNP